MMRPIAIVTFLAVGVVLGGCDTIMGPTQPVEPPRPSDVVRLPNGAVLDSALLQLYVRRPGGQTVVIHPAMSAWDEMSVTWDTLGPGLSPFVINTFVAVDTGWVTVNVTPLVTAWNDGVWENNGLILDQNFPEYLLTSIDSREAGATGPRLQLHCSDGGLCRIQLRPAMADAYVQEDQPEINGGGSAMLYSGAVTETSGEYRSLIRFELAAAPATAAIGDWVWNDLDADGLQDPGEPGLAGVTINLYNCASILLGSAVTDVDGRYAFGSVDAGDYMLEFVRPEGYASSPLWQGADPALDSDADEGSGFTACFTVTPGENSVTRDAGFYALPPSGTGCTHSKGWWKSRTGFGKQTDEVSALLPITLAATLPQVISGTEVHQVLQMLVHGHPNNGITRLYSELLVAWLNKKSGADTGAIDAVMAAATGFLDTYHWSDWDLLDHDQRRQVIDWWQMLKRYNGGEIGPGSCDDVEPEPVAGTLIAAGR